MQSLAWQLTLIAKNNFRQRGLVAEINVNCVDPSVFQSLHLFLLTSGCSDVCSLDWTNCASDEAGNK